MVYFNLVLLGLGASRSCIACHPAKSDGQQPIAPKMEPETNPIMSEWPLPASTLIHCFSQTELWYGRAIKFLRACIAIEFYVYTTRLPSDLAKSFLLKCDRPEDCRLAETSRRTYQRCRRSPPPGMKYPLPPLMPTTKPATIRPY